MTVEPAAGQHRSSPLRFSGVSKVVAIAQAAKKFLVFDDSLSPAASSNGNKFEVDGNFVESARLFG